MKQQTLKKRRKSFATILVATCFFIFTFQGQAQRVSVNINVNTTPREVVRYVETPSYYYYPEIETYYDVNSAIYIYYHDDGWVRSRYLPVYYRDYDVRHGSRVVLDYRGDRPYTHYHEHKNKYKSKSSKKHYKHKGQKHKHHKHNH